MAKRSKTNFDQLDGANIPDYNSAFDVFDDGHDNEQIQTISLVNLMPDPSQPRRTLPSKIRESYFRGDITAKAALGGYIDQVFVEANLQGRVYTSVLDLLNRDTRPDRDTHPDHPDMESNLLPGERILTDITNLAQTIRDGGLVNPLLVIAEEQEMITRYRIIAGSRRFWAGVMLAHFVPGYEEAVQLPCRVASPEQATVWHQAVENTSRSDLNAVALARQLALLLYAANDISIEREMIDDNWYRRATELDLRSGTAREHTETVLNAMGGISKARLSQIKRLLNLTPTAMRYGDEYNLSSKLLERLAGLSEEEQQILVADARRHNWTEKKLSLEIDDNYRKQEGEIEMEDKEEDESRAERAFARKIREFSHLNTHQVATALKVGEGTYSAARVRLSDMRKVLDEIERELDHLETQKG